MQKTIMCLCLILFAGSAMGQQAMSGDEIKGLVSGKTLETSGGTIAYKADGKYDYYDKSNGSTFRGNWSVQGDQVCVAFDNGNKRCDQFVKEGTKVSLKNSRGQLFPVTSVK